MLFQHKANGAIFLWTIVAIPLKTFSEKNLSVWFSAPKLLEHFLQFVLALSKTFLDSNATLESKFTQHSYLKLQWHYSCSKEFMNLGFIIAYIFSVDKHKIKILTHSQEGVARFCCWEGWYEKTKLMCLSSGRRTL